MNNIQDSWYETSIKGSLESPRGRNHPQFENRCLRQGLKRVWFWLWSLWMGRVLCSGSDYNILLSSFARKQSKWGPESRRNACRDSSYKERKWQPETGCFPATVSTARILWPLLWVIQDNCSPHTPHPTSPLLEDKSHEIEAMKYRLGIQMVWI